MIERQSETTLLDWMNISSPSILNIAISWLNHWLNSNLSWFVSPLSFPSCSLWWFWSSLLSTSSSFGRGANWLAICSNPLIACWKLYISSIMITVWGEWSSGKLSWIVLNRNAINSKYSVTSVAQR